MALIVNKDSLVILHFCFFVGKSGVFIESEGAFYAFHSELIYLSLIKYLLFLYLIDW